MRYRYSLMSANDAGVHEHPQTVILRWAPDATNFEPVPIADCWLFEAGPIENQPPYIYTLPELHHVRPA
jgi:hypothetical protein